MQNETELLIDSAGIYRQLKYRNRPVSTRSLEECLDMTKYLQITKKEINKEIVSETIPTVTLLQETLPKDYVDFLETLKKETPQRFSTLYSVKGCEFTNLNMLGGMSEKDRKEIKNKVLERLKRL